MRTLTGLVVALSGLMLAGCTPDQRPEPPAAAAASRSPAHAGQASQAHQAETVAVVSCEHVIDWVPPSDSYELVLEAVALPTRTTLQAEYIAQTGWWWAKQGLVVRSGAVADIVVPPEAAGRLQIGWGSPATFGEHVRVSGCESPTGWLAFAGGYEVTAPACVPLIVRSGAQEARVRIGVGAACVTSTR